MTQDNSKALDEINKILLPTGWSVAPKNCWPIRALAVYHKHVPAGLWSARDYSLICAQDRDGNIVMRDRTGRIIVFLHPDMGNLEYCCKYLLIYTRDLETVAQLTYA